MLNELTVQDIIKKLNLEPLPQEGGYFKRTLASKQIVSKNILPQHSGDRSMWTCIYYLITAESFSALHVLKSDEIWCYHAGDPVKMVTLDKTGQLNITVMGPNLNEGQKLQCLVPKNVWQGSQLLDSGQWCLFTCMVSPGFEYDDTCVEKRENLLKIFPQHTRLIHKFTRAK